MGRVWRRFGCRRGMAGRLGMGRKLRVRGQLPQRLKPRLILSHLTARLEAAPFQNRAADRTPSQTRANDRAPFQTRPAEQVLRGGLRFAFRVRWGVLSTASSV